MPSEVLTISMDFERNEGKLEVVEPSSVEILEFNTPNLFAYGATRHLAHKNFEKQELSDPTFNLLSDLGELYDPEQVLISLDYASIKEQNENKEIKKNTGKKLIATKLLDTLKRMLVDLLPDIEDTESIIINPISIDGNKNAKLVEIQTPDGRIPLFDVSLGYQTMLTWAVDLAIRMLWQNPSSEEPLKEPAVVIIDEIDLHLHPVWQRNLKNFLTAHFSQTQFICTAHSPFMAQSSELENLCVVSRKNKQVKIENDPHIVKGWRIGQIATSELFGLQSDRSPEIEELIIKRRQLLDKGDLSQQENIDLKTLDKQINNLPILDVENQRLLDQINLAANILREKGELND